MSGNQTIGNRYEIQLPAIGQGGMGVVFRAYDCVTRRYVALKTLRGPVERADLELFEKEWTLLARISHPNIVDILDTGEFQEEGQSKPFFVMPLLPGQTLDALIRERSARLTVERTVEIVVQACRGLQAAHDQGLVHRDLKPSNIFVMDDDAVKLIDFGVVHFADTRTFTGVKGTLDYMAPEQMQLKASTPQSDIFSLGVVAYEALTGLRPFAHFSGNELIEAIRSHIPPLAAEINPLVSQIVSQTVHKAMAKQPFHRYESARDFADTLQKAVRNERVEQFDSGRVQPRVERIKRAFEEGDFDFAQEILIELESEGYPDPAIPALRAQIDQAIRSKKVRELLDGARTRFDEEEFALALQKAQEALELDPTNAEAIAIKSKVEHHRSEKQLGNWFELIRKEVDSGNFVEARHGIDEVFRISPSNERGKELLREIESREQEIQKLRQEKERLFESALAHYRGGEISTALEELERALSLIRGVQCSAAEDDAQYKSLYEEIRQQQLRSQALYQEAHALLAAGDYGKVILICDDHLSRDAGDALFQALKLEAEGQQGMERSSAFADVNQRVRNEPDLDRKLALLQEASERYPQDGHFQQSMKLICDRRDLLNSVIVRAKGYEERGQLPEALAQWQIVRSIYPQHPSLASEQARLEERRDELAREQANNERVEEFNRRVATGDWAGALGIARDALAREPSGASPEQQQWQGFLQLAEQGGARSQEAVSLLAQARSDFAEGNHESGLGKLRLANQLDHRNGEARSVLLSALIERARLFMAVNWRAAEPYVKEAQATAPQDPTVRFLVNSLDDHRTREAVGEIVLDAHELQTAGDYQGALSLVDRGLTSHPNDARLSQLRWNIETAQRVISSPDVGAPASTEYHAAPGSQSPNAEAKVEAQEGANGVAAAVDTPPDGGERQRKSHPGPEPSGPGLSHGGSESVESARALLPMEQEANTGAPPRRRLPLLMAIGALLLSALAALGILSLPKLKTLGVMAPATIDVQVRLTPEDAHLLLDTKPVNRNFSANPGQHQLTAALDGYRSVNKPLEISSNTTSPVVVAITLEALPVELRVNSDLKAGRVLVDGKPADMLEGGFLRNDLSLGTHTVVITDGNKNIVAFNFTAEPGHAPTVGSMDAKSVPALIVSTLSNRAKVWATGGLRGGTTTDSPQSIPPTGLALRLSAGANDFFLDDGKTKQKVTMEASPVALVSVALGKAKQTGTLVLQANVQDATVLLNGVAMRRKLINGNLMLGLQPNAYRVQLQGAGYQSSAEQSVDLKAGDTRTLLFEMAATARKGTLAFEKFPPDTEVTIDDKRVGVIGVDGSLTTDLPTGTHSLILRRQGFEEITLGREVRTDSRTVISGDAIMRALGTVVVKITPAAARVSYRRDGETQTHEVPNGQTLTLKSGGYEFSAQADKYEPKTQPVTVSQGRPVNVDFALTAAKEQREPNPVHTLAATVRDPKEWTSTDGWWQFPIQAYGWFNASQGSIALDFLKRSSRIFLVSKIKRVEWVADYHDEGNRVVYELDDHQLRRHAVVDGKAEPEVKTAHTATSPIMWQVDMQITADRIVVKQRDGKLLDEYRRPKPQAPLGKLGFRGPIALAVPTAH